MTRELMVDAKDHRVRERIADAGTVISCALHLQRKIDAGQLRCQPDRPEMTHIRKD
jgi:hypothetical protein